MKAFLLASVWLVLGHRLEFALARQTGKFCPCQLPEAKVYMPRDKLPDDSSYAGMRTSISCCKDIVLGYHDPRASIQWVFNGQTYSDGWTSSLKPSFCGNETIESSSGKMTDSGNYSCTITASDDVSKTVFMTLTMEENKKNRNEPVNIKISSDKVALVGETADFMCESYIGTNDTNKVIVYWMKYFPNQTSQGFANQLPEVQVTSIPGYGRSWGTIKTVLMISSVREMHYGIYQCTLTNSYRSITRNITLKEGIPEREASMQWYKTFLMVAVCFVGVLVVLLLGWYRWGRFLYISCRHGKPSEDHEYDVFLIHGESASHWVWSVLLPKLENSFGYICFLPQRDMCGGTMVSESILEALTKCRRVIVVITPCLLESPWGKWATCSGIQTVLTSKTRILALVHEDEMFINPTPLNKNPLLNVLKVVRRIKVPENIMWDVFNKTIQHQLQNPDVSTQISGIHKKELKLVMPESIVSTILSNSLPEEKMLSNMINGSMKVYKKDMSYDDKRKDFGSPFDFTVHGRGQDELSSPSSITPFILSSQSKNCKTSDGSVCRSMCWCFRMSCMKNSEEQFWQILRLHIGPPSTNNFQIRDKT